MMQILNANVVTTPNAENNILSFENLTNGTNSISLQNTTNNYSNNITNQEMLKLTDISSDGLNAWEIYLIIHGVCAVLFWLLGLCYAESKGKSLFNKESDKFLEAMCWKSFLSTYYFNCFNYRSKE